jgi:protein involved in polysaccharide export with SLBB domain
LIIFIISFDTVRVGDILFVSVFGREEYSLKVQVPPSCDPYFPLIGRVKVCGLTLERLSDTLRILLKGYYDLPVIVSFEEISPPTILVLGEVLNQGSVRYVRGMRLSDALAQAGVKPTSDLTRIKLNAQKINLYEENPYLSPWDRVEVPPKWWKGWVENIGFFINVATFGLILYTTFGKK